MNMSKYPEQLINEYVWSRFAVRKPTVYSQYSGVLPFFPVTDALSDKAWGSKPYVVYDSMMRPRSNKNWHYAIKSGQMMYGIRGSIAEIYEWRDFISNVLDRQDQTAKELNAYAGANNASTTFFHSLETFQLNYAGSTSDKSETRKMYSTDLIIKYDYHRSDELLV